MIKKCGTKESKYITNFFIEKYGLKKELFKKNSFYVNQKEIVFLGPKNILPGLNITSIGIFVLRKDIMKPSSNFFQLFGKEVTKKFIEVSKDQAKDYVAGKDLEINTKENGYVLVRYDKFSLGCGFVKEGVLVNMLPKPRMVTLKFF